MRPPELPGILTRAQVAQTGASIKAAQERSGALPWPDGHTDAWNHIESAMGLLTSGEREAAEHAYAWLRGKQRPDGSWATSYIDEKVIDPDGESNQAAYVAVGTWHHWLTVGDRSFVKLMWPTVVRALDYVVGMQSPGGEIPYSRKPDGSLYNDVLLTGCSSTLQSLRCGLALADLVGEQQPDWELAAGALHHVLVAHPEVFTPKERWSMDWYYPVLGGALRGNRGARADPRGMGHLRRAVAGRALRERPAVGHRRRDVRAGHGAAHARRRRDRSPAGARHPAHPPRRRRLLDRLAVRQPGDVADRALVLDLGRRHIGRRCFGGRAHQRALLCY